MYQVTKIIRFCYGHRLLNYEGPCRFLHGHNAKAEITLGNPTLDHLGMVMDFNEVRQRVQGWIDATIDHKMLLNRTDPILPELQKRGEPFVPVDENPTAEVIARMIFDHVRQEGVPVIEVKLWETETSFATYGVSNESPEHQRFQRLEQSSSGS